MREPVNQVRLQEFFNALGAAGTQPTRVYLVGGTTAVLLGWREATIDIDLKLVPDSDQLLRSLPRLKEQLHINIELAAPDDFIPELKGWEDRSVFIQQVGKITFLHYDFYAQALAKIERGHVTDLDDVDSMINAGLIDVRRLLEHFNTIESELYRYPALDPSSFRRAVHELVAKH